ncbi:unnamed protein product [Larinioides sclopetarius]|uniref:15-hydroxyprostaglandin dehydrogenase [NAD(+)] n=1 Tax=Larinioides sclopetarius TaxID=280406 RepID=A0AAV2AP42_9ARAC
MNFAGKAAIITGGAQGIGRAYANALLDIGMKVCICDILEEKALDFIENIPETQKINTIFQKCDVSSLADLRSLEPLFLAPVYSATKTGVVGYTKSLGTDYHYRKTGIKVNAICPGPIDTALFHDFPSGSVDEKESKKLGSLVKLTKPEEVGKALLKLLDDDKNGSLLRIDCDGLRYA